MKLNQLESIGFDLLGEPQDSHCSIDYYASNLAKFHIIRLLGLSGQEALNVLKMKRDAFESKYNPHLISLCNTLKLNPANVKSLMSIKKWKFSRNKNIHHRLLIAVSQKLNESRVNALLVVSILHRFFYFGNTPQSLPSYPRNKLVVQFVNRGI